AALMFASSNTILGDFPPSSSVFLVKVLLVFLAIIFPVSVPPVKLTLLIPLDSVSHFPTFESPVITLTTPFGNPASSINLTNSKVVTLAYSDGLIITVLPLAKAGANLLVKIDIGEFQEVIRATTPKGILFV